MRSKSILVAVLMCVTAAVNLASADVIRGINIDFVTIGNPGNAADTGGTPGCGAVSYSYHIGKYEITNTQWSYFVAAAGAPTGNPSDAYDQSAYWTGDQQPTGNVSWYEAAQFCNYLTSGDKSKGAYQFSGNNTNPGDFLGINRGAAVSSYGIAYVIPTEDEWYKAAYHKNDGVTGNYWLYPTQSDGGLSNDLIDPDPGNNANFYQDGYTTPDYLTAVGEFENSDSAYGTFDQGGNIAEWTETLTGSNRYYRGGGCGGYVENLAATFRFGLYPDSEYNALGFRIASVPEPATLLLLGLGSLALLRKRRV